jgi:hypothetical protein
VTEVEEDLAEVEDLEASEDPAAEEDLTEEDTVEEDLMKFKPKKDEGFGASLIYIP